MRFFSISRLERNIELKKRSTVMDQIQSAIGLAGTFFIGIVFCILLFVFVF